MVSDDVHRVGGTFQIVTPGVESLVDGEELLIVGIIVEFQSGQHPRAECDQTDLTILTMDLYKKRQRTLGVCWPPFILLL